MSGTSTTRPGTQPAPTARAGSRMLAALVLVPAVPMLLLSVASLLLFYLAPTRFGSLLARLPGESFIRSALVFAPATLFAIVVLALLYAVEKPAALEPGPGGRAAAQLRPARTSLRTAARLMLAFSAPLWLFSLSLWSLSFISPTRYDRLMTPLPGDSYLRSLTPIVPWLLFALVIASALIAFMRETDAVSGDARRMDLGSSSRRLMRPAVAAVLTSAIPALLGSLAALGFYWLRPERFMRMLERLPFDTLVRAAMVFVPPTTFVVVVLATLYLVSTAARKPSLPLAKAGWRSDAGMFVLVAGLCLSAALGLGLFGSIVYLVLR